MNHILEIDVEALTARVQPGIYGPQLEAQLQADGFTLGHYPQSFEFSTLGGWVAARGAGQQCNRYGAAAKFLVGARVISPRGVLETKNFPNSAAGPDLNHLIAGSEGTLGFITEVSVRLHRLPAARDYRAYLFPNFIAGTTALRELVQEHTDVAMLRLSDESETHFYTKVHGLGKRKTWMKHLAKQALAAAGLPQRPCVLMVGLEGSRRSVAGAGLKVTQTCFRHRGIPAGTGPGQGWYETRFQTPYLRDHLMNRGIGIDTLETATSWSNLHQLHQAVREAVSEALRQDGFAGEPIVLGHISHSYQTGASLYFTYIFPMQIGGEIEQWLKIKRAASDAIRDNGGTISHHHGVGVDHLDWIEPEKGALGVAVLRATKKALDPKGLMNPGKLIP
jgi:alkyldihydroxyacetonephosphate synthase